MVTWTRTSRALRMRSTKSFVEVGEPDRDLAGILAMAITPMRQARDSLSSAMGGSVGVRAASKFSGRQATVVARVGALGFRMLRPESWEFTPGDALPDCVD